MRPRVSIERWEGWLQRAIEARSGPLRRAKVLAQTDSTQDAARRMDAHIGDVIVAGRQTTGRGRLGRAWADTGDDGVAVTMVLQRDRPERLAIASAVGACAAIAARCRDKAVITIKWPNDIMCADRKIAGILIEQVDDHALVGIGINVRQTHWPQELADRAVSLAQLGVRASRLRVMMRLLLAMQIALRMSEDELVAAFAQRDGLAGRAATLVSGGQSYRGKVLRVDPMKGLAVLTESEGEVWLPAATTSVIKD